MGGNPCELPCTHKDKFLCILREGCDTDSWECPIFQSCVVCEHNVEDTKDDD